MGACGQTRTDRAEAAKEAALALKFREGKLDVTPAGKGGARSGKGHPAAPKTESSGQAELF